MSIGQIDIYIYIYHMISLTCRMSNELIVTLEVRMTSIIVLIHLSLFKFCLHIKFKSIFFYYYFFIGDVLCDL